MKKRFLFTTLPTNDLGLLTRSLPIAKELSARGHSVVFSNPASAPVKVIAEAGFQNIIPQHPLFEVGFSDLNFQKLKALLFSKDMRVTYGGAIRFTFNLLRSTPLKKAASTNEVWDTDHAFAITGLLNKNFVKANCQAYIDVIQKSRADIVVDFWNPFACIAAKKLGISLITINQGDALPHSDGFVWWKSKPKSTPTVVPVINKVLKSYKLIPVKKIEQINVGDLTLVMGIPETDPLNGEHNFKYIGSVLWQNPKHKVPSWFEELPDDRPVIWLYCGNPKYYGSSKIFSSEIILEACFKALALEKCHVVLSTGHHELPPKIKNIPENFRVVSYVPGLAMAQRCDLMIHHGGYGSCQTGLFTGTPSLIIPTFSERESNARRIAALGAGEYVLPRLNGRNKRYADPEEIRIKALQILSNPSYKENAKRGGQKLNDFGGVHEAANLIENFIERGRLDYSHTTDRTLA